MPKLRISPDLEMFYLVDDYTDPWREPETILLLHGNAESGASWYAWAPEARASLPCRATGHAGLWRFYADAA